MQPDPKIPAPKSGHPQKLGTNKFNKQKKSPDAPSVPPPQKPVAPATNAAVATTPKPVAPSVPKDPAPGKDKSYFELTIKLVGSDEPPFTVETALTGNGAADKHNATAVARKKFPGRQMTSISSRIYTRSENSLSEISPGSTLSALFGASGEITGDLIEIGRAFYDGSRGTIFLRNLRTHVGVTFRPATGGLAVFSNRIVSNRLASELPMIVSEILGNGAREIEIYLKT